MWSYHISNSPQLLTFNWSINLCRHSFFTGFLAHSTCVRTHMHAYMYVCRAQVMLESLSIDRLPSLGRVSYSNPVTRLTSHFSVGTFCLCHLQEATIFIQHLVGSENQNSSPQACIVSTLTTKPSLQLCVFLLPLLPSCFLHHCLSVSIEDGTQGFLGKHSNQLNSIVHP